MGDLVPRNELVKQGWRGFGGVAGGIAIGVGAATLIGSLPGFSGVRWLMNVAGIALLAAGAWSLVQFFIDLRKRRG